MNAMPALAGALLLWCMDASGRTNDLMNPRHLFSLPSAQLRLPVADVEKPAPGLARPPSADEGNAHQPETTASESGTLNVVLRQNEVIPGGLSTASTLGSLSADLSIASARSELEWRVYRRLEAGGYLTKPDPGPDSAVLGYLASTFEPAVFHIGHGKATVTCSLLTAIKTGNPLCLLNPLFFCLSW